MNQTTDLERIFHAARAIPSGAKREAFVASACAGSDELLRQLQGLLSADADADEVFGQPATEQAAREAQ